MRALVLAAGVGSRLKPYTDRVPKPLVPIAGRPIVAYNLAMLAAGGFDWVVVNLHAFPAIVRDYIGDGSQWGVHVSYSEELELLGTAGALIPVRDFFAQDTFAVVFGDNLNELDMAAMLAFHRERRGIATVAVWNRDDVSQSGVAELDSNDRILRFVEKPRPGETASHWVNAGVIIAEPSLLSVVDLSTPSDLGKDVLPALIERGDSIFGFRLTGGHWWFDRTADYLAALDDPTLQAFARQYPFVRTS